MLTVWLTGLPSSGKTTLATALGHRLNGCSHRSEVLDGDIIRRYFSRDLAFSRSDRDENVRRVGWVADLLSRNGIVAVCALVSPYQITRDEVRTTHGARFFEVYLSADVKTCAERDVKGLYAQQRAGQIRGLSGVDDPYEPPRAPELVLPTHVEPVETSEEKLWQAVTGRLQELGPSPAGPYWAEPSGHRLSILREP